jgi:multiple sugar transport system substrate-binding protein
VRALPWLAAALALAGCGAEKRASQAAGPKGVVRYCSDDPFDTEARGVLRFNQEHEKRGLSAVLVRFTNARRLARGIKQGRCDVASMSMFDVAGYAAGGSLLDLTRHVASRRKEFFPATLTSGHYAGHDWALPLAVDVGVLYARTQTLPDTLQELYARGGFIYGDGPDSPLAFLETAYAAGGRVLTSDGQHSALDSPENARALALLRSGVTSGNVHGYPSQRAYKTYMKGHATFMRNWSSSGLGDDRLSDDRVKVVALPPFKGGRPATLLVGYDIVVLKTTKQPRAALAFLDARVSPAGARLPARKGLLSPLVQSYDDSELTSTPGGDSSKAALERAVAAPVTPHLEQIVSTLAIAVDGALSGRVSTRTALRRASKDIDAILATEAPGDES